MLLNDAITNFVAALAAERPGTLVNPWTDERSELDRPGAATVRRANLETYLRERVPYCRLLLVGEAPGYQGCRFSGIAFTSERSLPPAARSSVRPEGWSEPSATIVHRVLAELDLEEATILWNACPFHPAGPIPLSNRTPTSAELALGVPYLARLESLLAAAGQSPLVVAIGRSAARLLPAATPAVRHPANGGARLFRDGLLALAPFVPPK